MHLWLALHIDYHRIYLYLNALTFEIINDIKFKILSLDLFKKLERPIRKSNLKLEFDAFFFFSSEIKLWISVNNFTVFKFSFFFLFIFILENFLIINWNNIG